MITPYPSVIQRTSIFSYLTEKVILQRRIWLEYKQGIFEKCLFLKPIKDVQIGWKTEHKCLSNVYSLSVQTFCFFWSVPWTRKTPAVIRELWTWFSYLFFLSLFFFFCGESTDTGQFPLLWWSLGKSPNPGSNANWNILPASLNFMASVYTCIISFLFSTTQNSLIIWSQIITYFKNYLTTNF